MENKLHGDILPDYKIKNIFWSFKTYRQGTTRPDALSGQNRQLKNYISSLIAACAAASRAIGTLYGEQLT